MMGTISQAAALIKQGELVCFPTETVYALAADACNNIAVEKIFKLKGRHMHTPLAMMVPQLEVAKDYAFFNEIAEGLAHKFWPGPLTLILIKKKEEPMRLSSLINKGLSTIAIRIPDHPTAKEILSQLDRPIVATSVNPSGKDSATTPEQIRAYFGDAIPIFGSGASTLGIASTIIDVSKSTPHIIRQGSLTKDELAMFL